MRAERAGRPCSPLTVPRRLQRRLPHRQLLRPCVFLRATRADRAAETRGLSNEQMDVLFGAVNADVRRDNIAAVGAQTQHGTEGSIGEKDKVDDATAVSVLTTTA